MAQGKTVPDIPGEARKLASTIGNAFDKAGKLSASERRSHSRSTVVRGILTR
jgi:hypothetical protein